MTTAIKFIGFVMAGELVLHILLYIISRAIGKPNRDRINLATIVKGITERTFVVVVLQMQIASALTLLAALKIATRFKEEDKDNKVTNDFFLIGNLISILFGIGYHHFLNTISHE